MGLKRSAPTQSSGSQHHLSFSPELWQCRPSEPGFGGDEAMPIILKSLIHESSPATRTGSGYKQTQPPQPNRPSGGRRRLPLPHLRCQPAHQAGLHRPRRKVRHNGCRDRRSRWPPPWSTLDRATPTSTPDISVLAPTRAARRTRRTPQTPGGAPQTRVNPANHRPTAPTTRRPRAHRQVKPPASTGHSLSVQPATKVPSEEPHPGR